MPNLLIMVFPKLAPKASSIIHLPTRGIHPRVPVCMSSLVKMKWLRAVITPTKVMMLLMVPKASAAMRGEVVWAICLTKSLWMAALMLMPTPFPTRNAMGYRYSQ